MIIYTTSMKSLCVSDNNYTLVWYAFYNLRPWNAAGPILTTLEPTQGIFTQGTPCVLGLASFRLTKTRMQKNEKIAKIMKTETNKYRNLKQKYTTKTKRTNKSKNI